MLYRVRPTYPDSKFHSPCTLIDRCTQSLLWYHCSRHCCHRHRDFSHTHYHLGKRATASYINLIWLQLILTNCAGNWFDRVHLVPLVDCEWGVIFHVASPKGALASYRQLYCFVRDWLLIILIRMNTESYFWHLQVRYSFIYWAESIEHVSKCGEKGSWRSPMFTWCIRSNKVTWMQQIFHLIHGIPMTQTASQHI